MRFIKKIVMISGLFLCLIVITFSGISLYLYYHPERIKSMVEKSLSATAGSSCTIESLFFSLRPLVLESRGIAFETKGPEYAFSMDIPFIRADMGIGGPWHHRSLILENLQIHGISVNVTLPANLPEKKEASFAARMIQSLVGIFLFRDIIFQSGAILDGRISASREDQTIQLRQIHARAGTDNPLSVSFAMEANDASRKIQLAAPKVRLISASAFDMNDLNVSGTLQAEDMTLQGADLGIRSMGAQSKFMYSHAHNNLNIENLQVDIKGLAMMGKTHEFLQPIDASLQAEGISGRYPVVEITNAALQIPRTNIHTGTRDILIKDTRIHIPDGRIDTENKTLSFPKVRFDSGDLKHILLAIDLKAGRINVTLEGENTAMLQAAAAYRIVPPDWDLSAVDAIRIEAAGPEAGPWQVKTKLSVADLAFKTKDGRLMGEKISLAAETEGVVDLENARLTFTAALDAKTGEALFDRYYLNLAKNPIVASCAGSYELQQGLLQLSRFGINLTDILPLEIQGFLNQGPEQDAEFAVTMPQVPLKPIYYHLLQDPYQTEMPLLATLETGGAVSAAFKIKEFEKAWQVTGRIGWRQGSLALPDRGIFLKGIDLDLPVCYRSGLVNAPVEGMKGKFEVQSVTLPPLPEQPLRILLDAGPNRISVDSPIAIRVPGGNIRLGTVQAKNIFGPDVSVQSRLSVDGIKLQDLLSGITTISAESILTGTLDPVRYENHTVTSQGEITANVFGGKIIISGLGASGILTAAPIFKLNATWDDLLLTEMTTDTEFGKIEGVLKGHINDVEIANGQPQKFGLLMETVPKKGIPQTISIEAIDNIAQIGGGQSPFMGLAGAFASVFKKFSYEKIGIRARLENDMFTINGTIREDGTEYLVKRRGFSGVNIVNQNADNRISFKDMVKRINRIGNKGGPVIE
jgi:hypothetical protein